MEDVFYNEWLQSDAKWSSRLGHGWRGTKFLGQGSFGHVGLWEFKDNTQSQPAVKQVAIKQQDYNFHNQRDLQSEGRILALLRTVRSKHIIRMYGQPKIDLYNSIRCVRLFLEYCPGGDLMNIIDQGRREKRRQTVCLPILEADIWAVFNCLALGLAAIDRGTEDAGAQAWNRESVVTHYDIKPQNIFVGYKDPDHKRFPVIKFGDFGEAIDEPRIMASGYEPDLRGDRFYYPPEVCSAMPVLKAMYGTCCNVYQVGCVIHCLITRKEKNFTPVTYWYSQLNERLKYGMTQGSELESDLDIVQMYSSSLRQLVMECMMQEPLHRPQALELQRRTTKGLQAALGLARTKRLFENDPNPLASIPNVSNAWLEDPLILSTAKDALCTESAATPPSSGLDNPKPRAGMKRNQPEDDNDDEFQESRPRYKIVKLKISRTQKSKKSTLPPSSSVPAGFPRTSPRKPPLPPESPSKPTPIPQRNTPMVTNMPELGLSSSPPPPGSSISQKPPRIPSPLPDYQSDYTKSQSPPNLQHTENIPIPNMEARISVPPQEPLLDLPDYESDADEGDMLPASSSPKPPSTDHLSADNTITTSPPYDLLEDLPDYESDAAEGDIPPAQGSPHLLLSNKTLAADQRESGAPSPPLVRSSKLTSVGEPTFKNSNLGNATKTTLTTDHLLDLPDYESDE